MICVRSIHPVSPVAQSAPVTSHTEPTGPAEGIREFEIDYHGRTYLLRVAPPAKPPVHP